MASLQDQLLKAGLVDGKKAKQVSKEKRKQAKAAKHNKGAVDETKLEREKARQEKAEKDRELNRQRDKVQEQKAIAAQIRQLIQSHKKPKYKVGEEVEYNFVDGKTIKKIVVDPLVNRQLVNGQLAVVRGENSYELVPRIVAEKIAQRDAKGDQSYVVVLNTNASQQAEDDDDPYKDYQIPDDLMW